MRSPMLVLGVEVELDWAANAQTANVLLEPGRSIGNVSACDRGGELWYSSLLPDRQDTLSNHLEMLVRASRAAVAS